MPKYGNTPPEAPKYISDEIIHTSDYIMHASNYIMHASDYIIHRAHTQQKLLNKMFYQK